MHVVIFEVILKPGSQPDYLEIAGNLRALLEKQDGFLRIERFQSLNDPEKLLSLSFWRDEAAVRGWREQTDHRDAQAKGNADLFQDYRITVASALRSYAKDDPVHG